MLSGAIPHKVARSSLAHILIDGFGGSVELKDGQHIMLLCVVHATRIPMCFRFDMGIISLHFPVILSSPNGAW